jgi:hypothetical protein
MTHLSAEGRNNGVTILSLDGYQWLVEWSDKCRDKHLEIFRSLSKVKTLGLRTVLRKVDVGRTEVLFASGLSSARTAPSLKRNRLA